MGASTKKGRGSLESASIRGIFYHLLHYLARATDFRRELFPAERTEGDNVDNHDPDGHYANLRAQVQESFTFGGYKADTVNHRCQRQPVGGTLQPFRQAETREKGAGQEHHGEYHNVGQ